MTLQANLQAQAVVLTHEPAVAHTTLLDELLNDANLKPNVDGYDNVKRGLTHLITELLAPDRLDRQVDKSSVDVMIAEIDQRLSGQINAILHHPAFQKLEATWRQLRYLIEQVDFRENIKVEMLNVSKDDLLADFEDSTEVVRSGMYKWVYSEEYGVHGGQPYGLILGNYEFGPGHQDIALLQKVASVSAMAHAPFVAASSPEMFGMDDWERLPELRDVKALLASPKYVRWQSFRESEDSRYVGLALPRFLLREPYGRTAVPVKAFNFEEDVVGRHDHYLWGNAAVAFATRVADSFARYRWCPNIIGPVMGASPDDALGGTVKGLPLHQYRAMGAIQTKIPTEVEITEHREYELSEEGFISMTFRKDVDKACFFSANSCQKPKVYGQSKEGREAETNYRLGTQLPYMFIMTRIAHYLKVLQRENIGTWKERGDLERELNKWINQYVANVEEPPPNLRARCPLREARIKVEDVEGQAGWYRCDVRVRPHFKYMGATFTLALVGKMDKD